MVNKKNSKKNFKLSFINFLLFMTFPFSYPIVNLIYGPKMFKLYNFLFEDLHKKHSNSLEDKSILKKNRVWSAIGYPKMKNFKYDILNKPHNDFFIEGFEGISLSVRTYEQENKYVSKWVIVCHGWAGAKFNMLHIVQLYYKLGFNVLIYDARNHGYSRKNNSFSTLGYLEKFDLSIIINWLTDNKKVANLFLHGQSMGAATCVETLKILDPKNKKLVKGIIIDGCYDNLSDVLRNGFHTMAPKKIKLHGIFYELGLSLSINSNHHYNLKSVNPKDNLELVKNHPFCIIQGTSDNLTPIKMGETIYNNKIQYESKKISEFNEIKNGKHIQNMQQDPESYTKILKKFIDNFTNKKQP